MLTLNCAQANIAVPIDIFTGKPIIMDIKTNELIGQQEVVINDGSDFIKFAKHIEANRTCRTTLMNDTSSRTHCCVQFKLYKKVGENVHVSSFKLFDLAGSEKYDKCGAEAM